MTSLRLGSLVLAVEGAWPIPDTWCCSRTSSVEGENKILLYCIAWLESYASQHLDEGKIIESDITIPICIRPTDTVCTTHASNTGEH